MIRKITVIILSGLMQLASAQSGGISPDDIARLKTVSQAEISPDGKHILYGLVEPADPWQENKTASVKLYRLNVKSGESSAISTLSGISKLKRRPGGDSYTFTTKKEGDQHNALYEVSLSGGEARQLYQFSRSIVDYAWHPDGQRLAFIASSKEPADSLQSQLPYQPEIYEEKLEMADVYLVNRARGASGPKKLSLGLHAHQLQWSPDGKMLAVAAAPSSKVDDSYTSQKIYILDEEGKKQATVDHSAKLGDLLWSPDAKQIAFLAGEDKNDPTPARLFVVGKEGGKPRILQRDFKGSFDQLAWQDQSNLLFLASKGVKSLLGSIDMQGKMKILMEKEDMDVNHFNRARYGGIALVASTPVHPSEVYYMKSARGEARRLSHSNPWLKDRKLGKQQVYRYKADDGLEIEGLLIYPLAYEEGRRYPLITVVHGGPESHYDNGWITGYNMPGQMAAAEGYLVFYPNYRGSTGRGVEFARSSQGDPGGKEFDDIIHGIDHLIDEGLADGEKVGVTGGSYGGYATAWMSTRHSDRFAAGVMFVGISNNISKWGTSDIPEEMFLVHSLKRIWDDYDFFLKRSPIYYADQAKTPLLIMHGKEDTRVAPSQSFELYRHIKTRTDTPVRLVLYPGEGHGNRKSSARYDYSLRMMRWFNSYLKNENAVMPPTGLSVEAP